MPRRHNQKRTRRAAKSQSRTSPSRPRPGLERLEPRLLLSAAAADPVRAIETIDWLGDQVEVISDQWIVRLADHTAANDAVDALGLTRESIKLLSSPDFALLNAPGKSFEDLTAWADQLGDILYVEPNFVHTTAVAIPNDPDFNQLWGLNNTGQSGGTPDADIDIPEAWDFSTGDTNIVIAVIDTGADYNHVDLAANMWTNPNEIAGNFIDDDLNGFIDDVRGWDFAFDDNDPMDGDGHGTHVSGTIGAVGDNLTGVIGVAPDITIMPLKFLDDSGSGSTSDAIDAITYATMMKRDHGVNIIATNNSWGGGGFSQSLKDAIQAGALEDILFVAAAGNGGTDNIGDNNDFTPHYPSNYDLDIIISVAATDRNDNRASFSNFGATSVDLAGPGVSIRSTLPGNTYGNFNGTSMATPHVSGAVAILKALDPSATPLAIKNAILAGVDPNTAMSGISVTGGRLNVFNAMQTLGVPAVLSISPASQSTPVDQITINFSDDIAASSVVPTNFLLRDNGLNDIFGDGDDNIFTITAPDLSQPTPDTVIIDLGADLPLEQYRLTMLGTGANPIQNLSAVPLNDGVDEIYFFDIVTAPGPFEPNDILAEATDSTVNGPGSATFSAHIGDGLHQTLDVDIWSLQALAGSTITADMDAESIGSPLDTVLRLFDAAGAQLAMNDDTDGLDSFISYTVPANGTYYFGVSGWSNFTYDPHAPASGTSQTTGNYDITITHGLPPGPLGSIAGTVWYDTNGNGVNELSEFELDKQLVYLDINQSGALDSGSQVIDSFNVPLAVPLFGSLGSTTSQLVVAGVPGVITDINITLDITHTWDGDLVAQLVSPSGTEVDLFANVGSAGDDFSNTTFDDEGPLDITLGSAPFAGTYRPVGLLSNFDSQNANGIWSLQIDDVGFGDTGTLNSWSLDISFTEPTDVTDPGGNFNFPALEAGSYDVRFAPDAGWQQTHPADAHTVVLAAGQDVSTGVDFGARVLGDFNGDQIVDDLDIDLLLDEINFGAPDLAFDLNGDGAVDPLDKVTLLVDVIGTTLGDANLDFIVDVIDLGLVGFRWNGSGNEIPNPGWRDGDLNGDDVVDVADLGEVGFNWSNTAATAAVTKVQQIPATPDPTSLTPKTLILPALDLTTPTFAIDNDLASTRWNHIAAAARNANPFNSLLNHDDTDDDTPNPFNSLIPLPDLL